MALKEIARGVPWIHGMGGRGTVKINWFDIAVIWCIIVIVYFFGVDSPYTKMSWMFAMSYVLSCVLSAAIAKKNKEEESSEKD